MLAMLAPGTLVAQAPDAIRYTLRFPAPHTHYVEVEAVYPTGRQPAIEIYMAVWTPGSYLVREYERHVEGVAASADGRTLAVEKSRKNRWKVTTGGARVGDGALPRLLARDDGAQQLGRDRLRHAERRADVPHAGGPRAASPRGARRTARRVEGRGHGAAADGRHAQCLPRRGLRHAGGQPHHRRQPGDARVHGGRQEARPGPRRRPVAVRRRQGRRRRREDRPGRPAR